MDRRKRQGPHWGHSIWFALVFVGGAMLNGWASQAGEWPLINLVVGAGLIPLAAVTVHNLLSAAYHDGAIDEVDRTPPARRER